MLFLIVIQIEKQILFPFLLQALATGEAFGCNMLACATSKKKSFCIGCHLCGFDERLELSERNEMVKLESKPQTSMGICSNGWAGDQEGSYFPNCILIVFHHTAGITRQKLHIWGCNIAGSLNTYPSGTEREDQFPSLCTAKFFKKICLYACSSMLSVIQEYFTYSCSSAFLLHSLDSVNRSAFCWLTFLLLSCLVSLTFEE